MLAIFVLGVAVGIAVHRLIMAVILEKSPDDLCSYCEWMGRKKNRKRKGDS